MAKRSSRWRRKERGGARPEAKMGNGAAGCKRVRRVPGGEVVLELVEFEVSYDPLPDPGRDGLPEEVKRRLPELHIGLESDVRLVMEELKYYAALYPEVPMFQNWLAKGLHDLGRIDEARALAERTLQRHPDYFSGKLLVTEFALREGDLERVDALLGDRRTPQSFVSGRSIFHASEATGYFCLCGELDLAKGRLQGARSALDLLEKVAPDHPHTDHLRERLEEEERKASRRRQAIEAA